MVLDLSSIEPVPFALAGMNAHINHDLPVATVSTRTALATEPEAGSHPADDHKVDQLLDAIEQSVRQSFETAAGLALDRHLSAVATLIGNWSFNTARDIVWTKPLHLLASMAFGTWPRTDRRAWPCPSTPAGDRDLGAWRCWM